MGSHARLDLHLGDLANSSDAIALARTRRNHLGSVDDLGRAPFDPFSAPGRKAALRGTLPTSVHSPSWEGDLARESRRA